MNLKNRKILGDHNIEFNEEGLMDLLYNDKEVSGVLNNCPQSLELYKKYLNNFNIDKKIEEFKNKSIEERKNTWFIPEKYKTMNVEEYILNLCKTQEEIDRVKMELQEYKSHNMFDLLRLCIFLSEFIKTNDDVIIGIGRGSSVSSYILYLLEIHLVDSLKYNLDIKEFLK